VTDEAAIRVTAVGETRSRDRRLLMDGGVTSAVQELEKAAAVANGRPHTGLIRWNQPDCQGRL
jgi:hypothetical protein